jgi:pSer/pThr/pTyr-binding forkhead associated (FHA) protein
LEAGIAMDEQRSEKKRKTDRLGEEEERDISTARGLSFGARAEDVKNFIPLPIHLALTGRSESSVRWRVVLDNLGPDKTPLGLDILGDVVLGRGRVGTLAPDMDMEPYNAHRMGVSRRHALLRPTANNLFVIDLGSTNGTFHNGVRLGPGVARVVAHNDTLSLGNLTFTVKIVQKPEAQPARKLTEKSQAAKASKADDTKPFESTPETIAEELSLGSLRQLGDMTDNKEEVPTLIVKPGASPPPGRRPSDQPSEEERKEEAKAPEKAPTGPKAEAKKEEAKAPEKAPTGPKAEAKKEEAREPAPEPKAARPGAKEKKAEKPEETPPASKAEVKEESKK